jgi:adenylosuccinate synthase
VLTGLPHIDVCVAYEYKGKKLPALPASLEEFAGAKPIYKRFKSWNENVSQLTNLEKIPVEMRDYIRFIEDELQVKTALLSVGPDRAQTMEIRNPF